MAGLERGEENSGDEWRQCGDAKKGEQSGEVQRKGRVRDAAWVEERSVRELPGGALRTWRGRDGRRGEGGEASAVRPPLFSPSFPVIFFNPLPHLLILMGV